ncbi:MAG: hypothetical protein JSV32_08350 [Dehalococcoidia bacterium]|nr:MAG: hypothetical protein JSV32_08350 [Dehalococcoidia bacterium]
MKKFGWIIVIKLLTIIVLLFVGCARHPEGLDKPRYLTEDEKGRVIEIAFNTPAVQRQLETKAQYTTEINWLAITWNGSEWSAYYHIDAEWETAPNPNVVPDFALFYPYALIHFMEPASSQVAVAVDLEEGKVVLIHEYPAKKGPVLPGSDEIDVRLAPIHDIQIAIAESYPPQVMLYIKGGLTDGCTEFYKLTQERIGSTINITVTTRRPKGAICTQIYGFFEKNLNLGSNFVSSEEYTIRVNDITHKFIMQ